MRRRDDKDAETSSGRCGVRLAGRWLACATPRYPDGLPENPKAHVLAASLVREYRQNPVRFALDHVGDQVQFHGKVARIKPDGSVRFDNGGMFDTNRGFVVCLFADQRTTAALNRWDEKTVTGTVDLIRISDTGYPRNNKAYLTDCRLLE